MFRKESCVDNHNTWFVPSVAGSAPSGHMSMLSSPSQQGPAAWLGDQRRCAVPGCVCLPLTQGMCSSGQRSRLSPHLQDNVWRLHINRAFCTCPNV